MNQKAKPIKLKTEISKMVIHFALLGGYVVLALGFLMHLKEQVDHQAITAKLHTMKVHLKQARLREAAQYHRKE